MEKVNFEKFIYDLREELKRMDHRYHVKAIDKALKEQELECKDGEIIKINSDKLKVGNVLRHGGLLVLCLGGRAAVKCNNELFTIQYPDEWVVADVGEYDCFFRALSDNGYYYNHEENVVKKIISDETIDSVVQAYKDSLPFTGDYSSYSEALTHAFKQGIAAGIKLTIKNKL